MAEAVRVDVWLWSIRQCKTRSSATAACRAGHVRINDVPAKAASSVHVGDTVRYRVLGFDRILVVRQLLAKRVGAQPAAAAFVDLTPERPLAPQVAVRDRGAGRPTKRERRELDRWRGR